jgi:hypothetical protein
MTWQRISAGHYRSPAGEILRDTRGWAFNPAQGVNLQPHCAWSNYHPLRAAIERAYSVWSNSRTPQSPRQILAHALARSKDEAARSLVFRDAVTVHGGRWELIIHWALRQCASNFALDPNLQDALEKWWTDQGGIICPPAQEALDTSADVAS